MNADIELENKQYFHFDRGKNFVNLTGILHNIIFYLNTFSEKIQV